MKNITKAHLLRLLPKVSLLLLLTLLAQSCKKELFAPSQTKAQATSKIQDIKYAEFIAAVNTSGMNSLKELLAPANQGANGQKLMSTNIAERQFRIDMNAVKKLVLGDTVSYVVSLMPSSAHAVHFQNLTVQKIKDKTTAFLATYTPSKEWIADWKNGRHPAFSGTISFSRIDPKLINESAGTAANIEPASNQTSIGAGNGKVSSVATANKISLATGECEIYDVYETVMMPCKNGHYSRSDCNYQEYYGDWDIVEGRYDWPPFEGLRYVGTALNCAPPDMPAAPGGGGGGATTPTPPSDYDPCPGGAGAISYANVYGGLKLAVAAGNPCDGGETGLIPIPTNPAAAAVQSLIANLPITDYAQQQYLYNNTIVAVAIYNYLNTNGWTADNKGFASWAMGYLVGNTDVDFSELETTNNIPNSTINLPNLDVSELSNYPALKSLVENLPSFLNNYPNILKALSYTTGFSEKKIMQLMQPGKGPKVVVVNNLKDENGNRCLGQFSAKSNPNVLKIDYEFVEQINNTNSSTKYQAIGLMLIITTLHEFVHFSRNENNLPRRFTPPNSSRDYESGQYFEYAIDYNNIGLIEPSNAQEWLKYYRVKVKK